MLLSYLPRISYVYTLLYVYFKKRPLVFREVLDSQNN